MSVLAKFDLSGIQDFIFASNKLTEISGGSQIVKKTLASDGVLGRMLQPYGEDAKLQYSGGGNAIVRFKTLEDAQRVSRNLKIWLLQHGRGLRLCSGYCEYDEKTPAKLVFQTLRQNAEREKQTEQTPRLMGSYSINRLDNLTQAPICINKEKPYLGMSAQQRSKREEADQRYFELKFQLPEHESFIREFQHFRKEEDKNFLAIVHIDGNGMGELVKKLTEDSELSMDEALKKLCQLSGEINNSYENAFRQLIQYVKDRQLKTDHTSPNLVLPIRPIVMDGDDVTFVCDGKYGLEYAEYFIKHLNDLDPSFDENHLTASAGVAIAKITFPFSRAYAIAEQCCEYAKHEGRLRDKGQKRASWIDFHLCKSGITGDLDQTRKQYFVPYNDRFLSLCFRPWYIPRQGDSEECRDLAIYELSNFKKLTAEFACSPKVWARSKLKDLHHVMKSGKEAIGLELEFIRSRYPQDFERLITLLGGTWDLAVQHYGTSEPSYTTKLFDALEFIDFCSWQEVSS
ncbi:MULTISPECIES: Cas10/Cmr2 second palm domain-containing protein [Cohnella]|uniref:Cas10/Cmr2 second palm domain-containing protein n=1 Tax=Cohnella TaxID=329857 RepID=UPI0009BBF2BF|nr:MULTISPECIES: hypothetical protein [Cohnella]MBN2982172.1 hypothetical protein [Cohnella algarum]